jgi:hypothetical protein
MATRKATFVLVLSLAALLLISGCVQQETAPEEEPRGDPPFLYDQPTYLYEELYQVPEDYQEEFGCDPPEISDHCEGSTLYYDFQCVEGEWEYQTHECVYECKEGSCVNTGCPPCADGDPCTTDFCSGGPDYECIHIPISGCNASDSPISQKACIPTAGPGSYVTIEVYPAGVPASQATEPTMTQTIYSGQKMQLDGDDSITLTGFWLEGSCPECYYAPVLKFPPEAKLSTTKDLSGVKASYFKGEGELGYICVQGTCRKAITSGCVDYVCNQSMRFVVSEVNVDLTCS